MGYLPMSGNEHFHRGYSLRPHKSKSLINHGIISYSRHGVRVALAKTKDFGQVERVSLITPADYRNVVIFPEKFDGLYARLDRPHSEIAPWSIWISYSPDLRFWGESELIMRPEQYHWDEMKIGPGAPPMKTDWGWVSIYHGVFRTMDGSVYRLGVA